MRNAMMLPAVHPTASARLMSGPQRSRAGPRGRQLGACMKARLCVCPLVMPWMSVSAIGHTSPLRMHACIMYTRSDCQSPAQSPVALRPSSSHAIFVC